jgi:predicted HTH transcriptional regulator
MDTAELHKLISNAEDNFVERKTSLPKVSELRRVVVALANSASAIRKAVIFIGVEDDGTVQPITGIDSMQKTLRKVCNQDCYPPIDYTTEALNVQGGQILAIVIPPSNKKPHFTGHAYIRKGSSIEIVSEDALQKLIYARSSDWSAINDLVGPLMKLDFQNIKPGSTVPTSGSYHARSDVYVKRVTPQLVEVMVMPDGQHWTVPFKWVTLSKDDNTQKPMLMIKPV